MQVTTLFWGQKTSLSGNSSSDSVLLWNKRIWCQVENRNSKTTFSIPVSEFRIQPLWRNDYYIYLFQRTAAGTYVFQDIAGLHKVCLKLNSKTINKASTRIYIILNKMRSTILCVLALYCSFALMHVRACAQS